MKTIEITAINFARAVRICRKFLSHAGTAMAVNYKDMITIETRQSENGVEAVFYASDGYRAVSYAVPAVKLDGFKGDKDRFVVAIRNPVFTPKAGTHVTIELGLRNKKSFATVNYLEYGFSFATKQEPSGIKQRLSTLKKAIEDAAKAEAKAEFQGNSRYIRSAMEAVETANLAYSLKLSPIVHLKVNDFPNPLYAEGRGIKAVVLPTRN